MFGTVILSLTEGFMTTLKLFGLTLLLSPAPGDGFCVGIHEPLGTFEVSILQG